MHCSAGNATDPIWRVLASSDQISCWTPLKPQHSNLNPKPLANQLRCIDFFTPLSVAFFLSLKHNLIAYRSSKVSSGSDCIFEIHQLWQSGFSKVYSNCCCSNSFEPEIIKIGLSSHKMYSNNNKFRCLYKKSLETYWIHHIIQFLLCISTINKFSVSYQVSSS